MGALVHMPSSARAGEVFEVRALIAHPMETGFRTGADGRTPPRDIIRRFDCQYNGKLVMSAELHPAMSANPYLSFFVRAADSGTLTFSWSGDNGFAHSEQRELKVTP